MPFPPGGGTSLAQKKQEANWCKTGESIRDRSLSSTRVDFYHETISRYIYNSVPVISSMWHVQMFIYENCACAITENSSYDPESFLKLFFTLRYICWCALKHPS